MATITTHLERRSAKRLELRSGAAGQAIGGYGVIYAAPSRNLGGFREQMTAFTFERHAREGWSGVMSRLNHSEDRLLGSVAGGTLELRNDGQGLDYTVVPPASRADVVELVERGDLRHSAVAFRVLPEGDEWTLDSDGVPLRRINAAMLIDIGPVNTPPSAATSLGLRTLRRRALHSLAIRAGAPLEEVEACPDLRRYLVRSDARAAVAYLRGRDNPQSVIRARRDPWGPR